MVLTIITVLCGPTFFKIEQTNLNLFILFAHDCETEGEGCGDRLSSQGQTWGLGYLCATPHYVPVPPGVMRVGGPPGRAEILSFLLSEDRPTFPIPFPDKGHHVTFIFPLSQSLYALKFVV